MNPLFNENEKDLNDLISKANANKVPEYDNLEELKQGSKAWFNARLGKFTGSKIPDLMKSGRGKEEWGLTALAVIRRVFVERDLSEIGKELYIDELFAKRFRQTEWGNKYESYAREAFQKETDFNVIETHFELHPKYSFIGGSFDGIVLNKPDKSIIEIKCPYDPLIHQINTELDEEEMLKHAYYPQIQCNIEIAGAESCYFISFDPRRKVNSLFILEVKRDDIFINNFLLRALEGESIIDYMNSGLSAYEAMLLLKNQNND